jgi:hypothetical protein
MSTPPSTTQREAVESTVELDGITRVPTRVALATTSMSLGGWVALCVFLPIGCLLAGVFIDAQLASGVAPFCGLVALILWSVGYYQYRKSHLSVDVPTRTLTATQGSAASSGGQRTFTVELGSITAVSVHSVGDATLIRTVRPGSELAGTFTSPPAFVVSTEQLPDVLGELRTAGVDINESAAEQAGWLQSPRTRLVITGLVFAVVLAMAATMFGPSVFASNGTVTVAFLGLLATGQELRGGL